MRSMKTTAFILSVLVGTACPAMDLFNGKDLSGWTSVSDNDVAGGYVTSEPTWAVLDGVVPRNSYDLANALSGIAAVPAKTKSAEKPYGEWNALEIDVVGDEIVSRLNGEEMNRVNGVRTLKDAISLQTEGGVVEFRNIVIEPLMGH